MLQEFNQNKKTVMTVWDLSNAYNDITQGVYSDDPNKELSDTFQRFINTQEPIIVNWVGSSYVEPQLTEGGVIDYNKEPFKRYQVGQTLDVVLVREGYAVSIIDSQQSKTYVEDSTIVIRLNIPISQESLYKLFLLPELNSSFYYITNIEVFRTENDELIYYEIVLNRIEDNLNIKDVKTTIFYGSPGEEYAYPLITYNEEFNDYPEVSLDPDKLIATPIKYIQVTTTDPTMLGSFYAWGRRVSEDEEGNKYISEQRVLLPAKALQAETDPIFGINAPSDKYVWSTDSGITIGKEYKHWWAQWKEQILDKFNSDKVTNYGALHMFDINDAVNSAPNHTVTNDTGQEVTVDQPYWDDWVPSNNNEITYNTLSPYSEQVLENNPLDSIEDKLAKNVFINFDKVTLPLEYEEKVPAGLVNSTIGLFKKLILGIPAKIFGTNYTDRNVNAPIPLLLERTYVQLTYAGIMVADTGKGDANEYIPLTLYTDERPTIITGKNVNTMNLKIELTDEVLIDGTNVVNTADLGKEGTNYYNIATKVKQTTIGYLIDNIVVQGITIGKYKFTYFDTNNNPIASMIINSNSKKTNSLVDWSSVINTTKWDDPNIVDLTPEIPGSIYAPNEFIPADINVINIIPDPYLSINHYENYKWSLTVNYIFDLFDFLKTTYPEQFGALTATDFVNLYQLSYTAQVVTKTVQYVSEEQYYSSVTTGTLTPYVDISHNSIIPTDSYNINTSSAISVEDSAPITTTGSFLHLQHDKVMESKDFKFTEETSNTSKLNNDATIDYGAVVTWITDPGSNRGDEWYGSDTEEYLQHNQSVVESGEAGCNKGVCNTVAPRFGVQLGYKWSLEKALFYTTEDGGSDQVIFRAPLALKEVQVQLKLTNIKLTKIISTKKTEKHVFKLGKVLYNINN